MQIAPPTWPINGAKLHRVRQRETLKLAHLAEKRLAKTLGELARRRNRHPVDEEASQLDVEQFAALDLVAYAAAHEDEKDDEGAGAGRARDAVEESRYQDFMQALYKSNLLGGLSDDDLDVIEALVDRLSKGKLTAHDWVKLTEDLARRRAGPDRQPRTFRR